MRSLCLFSSFFAGDAIPYYVKIYLEELNRHFSQIIFLTNDKRLNEEDKNYLVGKKILLRMYKNEGFDFGMWYKAFMEFPVLDYDRIGLVNDSCILFKKVDFFFDWLSINNVDYSGITDSSATAYHIQSYFVVMNVNAIKHVYEYFKEHKVKDDIKNVIQHYEVGLCTYLLSKNLKLNSFFKHGNNCGQHNPMLFYSDDLIKKGMPLIKKKIIYCSFRKEEYLSLMRMNFDIDPRHHIELIKKVNRNNKIMDFDLITKDIFTPDFFGRLKIYKIKNFLFQIIRKFKFWK